MPVEAYYWLLGVCFSKITYSESRREAFKYLRPSLTYITEEKFARYLKEDIFNLDVSLIKVKQGKSQGRYGFHFPESRDTYAHHFQSRGILIHKERREFPDIDKKFAAHFIRGYFECQNSIQLRKRETEMFPGLLSYGLLSKRVTHIFPGIYVYINFSNYDFANTFVTFLYRNNIQQKKKNEPLKIHPRVNKRTWKVFIIGENVLKFYNYIYDFPFPILFRESAKKKFDEALKKAGETPRLISLLRLGEGD
jgi:hypothetical protein